RARWRPHLAGAGHRRRLHRARRRLPGSRRPHRRHRMGTNFVRHALVAVSNRDRIGKMFDLLSPQLEAFIHRAVGADVPQGHSWVGLVQLRDTDKGITGKSYAAEDPHVQLRFITEGIPNQVKRGWRPFRELLTRVQESYASELRDVRNDWAHGRSFADDD